MRARKIFTLGEEIANSITHGVGTALSIAGTGVLVTLAVLHGDFWRILSFSLYGASLICLFLASTLYHAIPHQRAKHIFRIIDHSSIYLLIAGTYTPFLLVSLRGPWGWTLFAIIATLAVGGIFFKIFFIHRFEWLSLATYLLMGWMCIMAMHEMIIKVAPGGLMLLITGGLLYTFGVVFYVWHKLRYNHMIWHLFVLAASMCHYFAILFYVQ